MEHRGAPFEYVWKLLVLGEPLYIHGAADRWHWPPQHPSSFSFILACLLPDVSLSTSCSDCLIYHWNQIWKCRSLHQGPDTLLRVQSGGIMGGGGPLPGYRAMRGSVASGYEGAWGMSEGGGGGEKKTPLHLFIFMTKAWKKSFGELVAFRWIRAIYRSTSSHMTRFMFGR